MGQEDPDSPFWRRESQPTPVFLPGESHGKKSLVVYSPWSCKESDMTERLSTHKEILIDMKVHKNKNDLVVPRFSSSVGLTDKNQIT